MKWNSWLYSRCVNWIFNRKKLLRLLKLITISKLLAVDKKKWQAYEIKILNDFKQIVNQRKQKSIIKFDFNLRLWILKFEARGHDNDNYNVDALVSPTCVTHMLMTRELSALLNVNLMRFCSNSFCSFRP